MLARLNLIALCTTGKCKKQCGKAPVGGGRMRKVGVRQEFGEATEKNFGLASTQGLAPGSFGRGREMSILAGIILMQSKERLNERRLHVLWGSMPTGFPGGLPEKGYCGSTGSGAIVTCLSSSVSWQRLPLISVHGQDLKA